MALAAEEAERIVPRSEESAWESALFSFKEVKLLRKCIQCGTCSGSCHVAPIADYTPRMIVNMVARGDYKAAMKSKMIFLCTGCLACTTRCPRDIPVSDVMLRLRNMALASELAGPEDAASSSEFVRNVLKRGRVFEPELMIRFAMRTNPLSLLGMRNLALALFQKGKLGLPSKSGADLSDLKARLKGGIKLG